MSKCTYNYNGVEYSELEFKKILKDLELPLSELSQEDLNLFKEHVMFIHDIQNYRLLNRYTVIHNNGYYDTAIRKVLIPVDSINKENILANIIKFKGLNPLFNLYHLFNEHTIKLIDSTPEIDSKDRLYEYRLAMLLQNNVENTWLNKLLLDLQIGINNTLNTNYDLEVIKNFLSHNINIVESQTVLPDTTESIDVESLLNQLGLDGKTEFEQEPNVEIVDFVTEIRQLANTDISNIQTQNQNKSNELIRLYRIENTNILYDESIEGIVSKREIIGQFFTDSINTVANYLKKNQKEDGINLVYVDIPKSDLDKYHVSNNEFSKTMDVESDNWIIPQSIARNYVDLSSVTKVTGNFLTLNKAKKELTEIINNLPEPKLNNNFIGNFSAEGRGTFEGDGKDKAMRNQAVGFIGELNPNKEDRFDSSTYGSFKHFNNNSIEEERYLENVPEDTSNGNKIMLALNGSIADTDILQKTKDKILELHNRGFEFLVGDMPGGENRIGDDKFIDYLKSIGANFTVFGSGNNSRILYQRVELTEQQRQNIQELKQLEPAYAVASNEKVQEFIDTIYPEIETQFNKEQITNLNSPETINKFNEFIGRIDYQLVNQEDIIATEKTIRDLAARISDRIGIPYKIISDRTQEFKGKLENGVAVINLAYATLDTSIHEILGHPIIRAIKETNKTLFNNLLKELEYGRGKDILDRIKRDYVIKYNYPIFNTEIIKVDKVYRILNTKNNLLYAPIDFKSEEDALKYINVRKKEYSYTLEEQQEEAIVELLGMMTAEKLDAVKDGKLISLLKRLLKEMKAFMRSLINQKEVEIDKLPNNMTLGDLSDLLAYSNSKLILPGYEVEYTTPDDKKFKTYQEASNHISELAKSVEDVDLNNLNVKDILNNKKYELKEHSTKKTIKVFDTFREANEEGEKLFNESGILTGVYPTESSTLLQDFIYSNEQYEQSKEIIEEWKKVNNIVYNPEEIYSRGQEFSSVVGAYSSFDVNLMMQNLLSHIEDNEKAGGKFAISAYTKPADKQIGHLEGGGGKIKFKLYPQSNDILWAANTDVYSGSVWDASEKVNEDKKSELLGVSYTKYPSLSNINAVQPNLAAIVDDLSHHHNELGIVLTGNNFRLEYDEDIPYSTKKIIDSINSILDQKYGKLVKPEIKKQQNQRQDLLNKLDYLKDKEADLFATTDFDSIDDNEAERLRNEIEKVQNQLNDLKSNVGIQPTQTNETLKEKLTDVAFRVADLYEEGDTYGGGKNYLVSFGSPEFKQKEYTQQALINTKIAKLKEVAKKYPRSLIRSEVKKINEHQFDELSFFQKIPINVEKLFEDEKFANEVYESLGYKNDTTLPDDNKVHKILSDINKQHHLGNIIDLDGYPIYNSEDIIFQNGLVNLTSNQWGHGATRIPYGKKGIERLENILSKSDRFTGDFGPIAGTELAKINQYPNTWESGRFIITRDDKDFYDKDGSLNINNIEIILNRSFEPYGNYLANKYPNIIFKDVFGNIIKISNQLTPKQKQEAIHLYSQYLKQNPNGDVENFKSWIEEFKNEIYESLGYDIRQLEEDNMITNLFLEARQDEDNKRINSGEFDDTKLDLKVELQDIIDNSTNPLLVELARSIQYNKSLNSIKAFSTQKPFITSDGFQPAAAYQAETQRLILFLGNKSRFANKERKYQYLLHELVHHFVDRQLILTYSSHANNIKELFKYAKDELTKLGKEILYGLQNAHEFVTEALTNPDFQRELKNLKVSDKFLTKVTSLFDYLLELISNILGTNQSVLEAVITQASDIFEIQEYKKSLSITPEQKQEALSLYSKYVELNPNGNIEEFKSWVNEFNNMTKLQGAYDFSASSNSGKWNSANNELLSLVQDNRKAFAIYKFLIGDMETFKEIVDYLNERGIEIPYTDRMKRADETMSEEERKSAIDSYNSSVDSKIEDKAQVEKNILSENNLQDEIEYTPQELIEKYPLTGVQKVIWNLIKDIVNNLGIKVKFSSSRITEGFDGSNNPQNGEILIRPSTLKNGRFGEVLVHEIVHALTTKIISRVNSGVTTGLTQKQISAVKGLMKLFEAIKADNNLENKYPVKDVFEFIAHLTNETFVKELESKDKNFLQKIVDFILDILGINNANELAKKYLLDIISDGTFLQENGITILPSDYGNNLQGSLSDFISQKSQEKKFEEKKVQIENEIKKLPIEIFNTIEIVDKVPLEILGRNDLYLSLKEILNEKNIKDELLINWLGIKKDTVISAKEVKSENHLLDLIKNIYDKKTDVKNHIELQSNQLASESFSKWVTALDKYPLPFKELMLSHAIKHLNPQRRSKFVLQLSEIALTNTFGMVMNKPYELNRVGKLYDQEVIKTVSDAVGHEPSASGKGYWVHIPRMKDSNKNTNEYNKNRELLRKLSPSTWCTATTHTDYYLTKYDNYLLIVDGITMVGIEAGKIGSNGRIQINEVTSRNNNDIASIDYLEDTIAFFEKHNLDLNNSSIKSAIELKNSNITDSHFLRTVGYAHEDYSDETGLNINADWERERRFEEQVRQEIIRNEAEASTLNNLEDVWTFLKRGNLETSAFPSLQIQFRNNYEIAKFSVEDNPHSIIGVEHDTPFYLELAKIAVEKAPQVYTYLNEKAKVDLNIKSIYENYTKELEEKYIDLENINDDLPFSKTNENLIQGYYDVRNDKVVIVASNTPIEEAAKIAIHEVSHRGIISMMRLLDKATDEDINKMIKEGIIKKECK